MRKCLGQQEPPCNHADGHDWKPAAPGVEIFKDLRAFVSQDFLFRPGAARLFDVCAHCGVYRRNTYINDGLQITVAIDYLSADDTSRQWALSAKANTP